MEFNVPFKHKYGYIRDERSGMGSYPYPLLECVFNDMQLEMLNRLYKANG